MQIKVYACPSPGCGNYYGTGTMPDLATQIVGKTDMNYTPRHKEQWHTRARCPSCATERVLVAFDVPDEALAQMATAQGGGGLEVEASHTSDTAPASLTEGE